MIGAITFSGIRSVGGRSGCGIFLADAGVDDKLDINGVIPKLGCKFGDTTSKLGFDPI